MSESKRKKHHEPARKHRRHLYTPHPLSPPEKTLLGFVAAFVVLRFITTLIGTASLRLWGLDFGAFVFSPLVALVLLLPLVMIIPRVATRFDRSHDHPPMDAHPGRFWLSVFAATGLLLVLADTFPVLYSFLGDGGYCHTEVFRIRTDAAHVSPVFDKLTAYGTGIIIRGISDVFEFNDNRYPFVVLGFTGLILMVPGLFYLLRRESFPTAMLMITLLLLGPTALFFFGYVETYTLQYVFLAFFFASSYVVLSRGGSWYLPAALLGCSVVLGFSSIIYLPALAFVALHAIKTNEQRLRIITRGMLIIIVVGFAGLTLALGFDSYDNYILPVVPGPITISTGQMLGWLGYTMFSLPHLVDMLNIIVMSGGAILAAGLGALFLKRKPAFQSSPLLMFGLLSAIAGFCMLLGGNAMFGLARDWDLAMFAALGISFFFAAILIDMSDAKTFRLAVVLPAIMVTMLTGSAVWIGLNASNASAKRLESLADMDAPYLLPRNTSYGYESLRKYYTFTKDREERLRITTKMIPVGINVMTLLDQTIALGVHFKDRETGKKNIQWCVDWLSKRIREEYPPTDYRYIDPQLLNEFLASTILRISAEDEAYSRVLLASVQSSYPDWDCYPFIAHMTAPDLDTLGMVAAVTRSIALDAKDPYLLAFGAGYMKIAKNYDMATQYLEQALKREAHRIPMLYFELGTMYEYMLGDTPKAIATLERGLDSCRLSTMRPKIYGALNAIKQQHRIQ